jgi:cytoskeleton protein RodZ
MLRSAREALGISPREMAARLNWIPSHLIAVEENRFENLRGDAFARGYLRAYAKQVEVSESVLLKAYDTMLAPELPDAKDSVEIKSESPLKKPEVSIALGLVCAVLLVTGLWWWQSPPRLKPLVPVTKVSEEPITEELLEQPAASEEGLIAVAKQFAETETALEESALEEADAEVAEARAQATLETALDQPLASPIEEVGAGIEGAESNAMLQFRFSGDCWVEVRDGNDELIFADLRREGESFNLNGLPPFNITVGDSRTVELRFQGEPVAITPRRGRLLARVTVGAP